MRLAFRRKRTCGSAKDVPDLEDFFAALCQWKRDNVDVGMTNGGELQQVR